MKRKLILSALPLFFLPAIQAVEQEGQLILWFDFEELVDNKVPDQTPNGLDASLHNAPTLEAGIFGQSMKFNGTNQRIFVPHQPILDTDEYTVAIWFKSIKSNEGFAGIFGRGGRHYAFWTGRANTNNWFVHHRYKDGTNTNSGAPDAGNFPHHAWTHVALTNDGRTSASYVNGQLRTSGIMNNSHNYLPSTLYIGANPDNGNGTWFDGWIDDVRLYGTSLKPGEVTRLYNNGMGDFMGLPTITLSDNGPLTHELGTPFTAPTATATDPEDGDISHKVKVQYTFHRNVTRHGDLAAWWKFEPEQDQANLLSKPEDFANPAWVASRLTIGNNAHYMPLEKISDAEALVEDDTPASSHQIYQVFPAVADQVYTATIYAKADTRSHLSISFRNYSKWEGGGGAKTTFDLSAGTSSPDNSTPQAHSIQAIGQGWYRCRVTAKATANFSSGISILLNDGTGTTYDGDGASQLFIWGAQVEEGDSFTPYHNPEAAGKVLDSTPYASHGHLVGNATFSPGKFGMALDLDGAGDYALIPALNSITESSGITISAWSNIDSVGTDGVNDAAILSSNDNANRMILWFNADGAGPNQHAYSVYFGNISTHLPATPLSTKPQEWQHVVAVMDNDNWRIYLDGALEATGENTRPNILRPFALPHRIGSWNATGNMDYPGLIDDVRVYDVALDDGEVAAIYGGGDGDFTTQDTTQLDVNATGEWTVAYSVADSSSYTTTVEVPLVVFDPDAPTIQLLGEATINHEQGAPWTDPGVTIVDKDGNNIADQSNLIITGEVDPDTAGTYFLTYDYTDDAGHQATAVGRTIHVADTIAPVLSLTGEDTLKIQVGQPFIDPGFSASDSFEGDLVPTTSILIPDHLKRKAYTPGYPETILNFDNNGGLLQSLPVGEELVSEGPRGIGVYYDGDANFLATGIGLPNGDNFRNLFIGYFRAKVAGTYNFGGQSPDDRLVVYLDLDQDNVFELMGERGTEMMTQGYTGGYSNVDLEPGYYRYAAAMIEGGGHSRLDIRFTAPEGGGPTFRSRVFPGGPEQEGIWFADNTFNTAIPGTHTITYTAQDQAGNTTQASRTVIVDDYPERPKIQLAGRSIIKHAVGEAFTEPGATVTDSIGQPIANADAIIRGIVNVDVPGKYILTYNYRQADGLAADTVTRAVEVVDAIPPVITLEGPATVEIILGQNYNDPGYSALDALDGPVEVGSTATLPSQGLVLHADASSIPGIQNGEEIPLWPDISGSGNDFIITKGAPKYAATALNGLPAVEFSGSDILTIGAFFNNRYSILTVSQLEGSLNQRFISSYNRNWLLGYYANREDVFHPAGWASDSTGVPPSIRPHLYTGTSTGGNHSRFYADGRDLTISPARQGDIGRLQLGGYNTDFREPSAGFVSEVIVYNRAISTSERLDVEARLASKYKLMGYPNHPLPDFSVLGDHTVLYAATDTAGNTAFATRTVRVLPDPSIPVIHLTQGNEIRHEANTQFVDPGAVVKDGDGNDLDQTFLAVIGTIDPAVQGIQTLTYRYDSEDLSAEPVTRDVLVVDTMPPVISFSGEAVIKLNIGDEVALNDAAAVDAADGDVSLTWTNPIPKIIYTPGLLGGGISARGLQMGENPGDLGIVTGPTLGSTNSKPPWKDNYTAIYTGEIYDEDGTMSFRESIDDIAWLNIDGKIILNNSGWNQDTTGTFVSDSGEGGWFTFELRMNNGTGGAGQVNAPGFGHDALGGTNFVYPQNPDADTPELFRITTPDTNIALAKEAGTFDIVYTATDSKGHTVQTIRTIVILPDPTTPYVVLNGEPTVTIEAATIPNYDDPLAIAYAGDGTEAQIDIAGAGTVDTNTPGTYILTYIYQAPDGTFALPVERTVHVVDTTPPVISLQGDSFLQILVGEDFVEPGATATDNLDASINVLSDLETIPNRLIHNGYLLGWDESNVNFEGNGGLFEQTPRGSKLYNGSINYGSDAQFRAAMPAITRNDQFQNLWYGNFQARRDGDYQFGTDNTDDRSTFWLDKDQDGVFEREGDSGDERLTWQNQTTPAYLRKGTYKVAIAHMEGGGRSRVRARFSTPESAGPTALTVVSPASPEQTGIWSTIPQSMDTDQPGRYKITYYAEDSAGNVATAQRTVVIDEDPLKPVLLLLGDGAITHEAGIPYQDPGVLLEDHNGNPLDESLVTVTGLPTENGIGQFTIVYEYTDPDGHTADPVTRFVNIFDTIPPTIELVGGSTIVLPIGAEYQDPGAIASDIFDKAVPTFTDSILPDGLVLHLDAAILAQSLNNGETIDIAWTDISGAGNHASNNSGDPTLVLDGLNGHPVVNFDGNDAIWTSTNFDSLLSQFTLMTVARYTGGASYRVISSRTRNWLFGFHNNGTGRFFAEGWVHNGGPNDNNWHQHTGTINNQDQANFWRDGTQLATDHGGAHNTAFKPGMLQLGAWQTNREASKCEVAEVLLFNRVLEPDERLEIESHINAKYNLNGGGDLINPYDTSTVREFTVNYYAIDRSGHEATAVRTVRVVDPATLPIINLDGEVEMEHSSGTPFIEPGYSVSTPQGALIPEAEVTVSTNLNIEKPGTYTVVYDFTDEQDNPAQSKVRTINVVDQTGPVITLTGGDVWEHQIGNDWIDPGYVGIDAVEGEVHVDNSYLLKGRLRSRAYLITANTNEHLNFNNNGGLYLETPVGTRLDYSNGPRNEGLRVIGGEFDRAFPSLGRRDRFVIIWDGHFHTENGGRYEFGVENPDDGASLWIDLDQDDIFEDEGDLGSERINPIDYRYGYRTFDLKPGFYKFAVSFREWGGGESIQPRMRALAGKGPSNLTWINPGAANQRDLWVLYNPFDVNAPGEHEITYTATDSLGNNTTVTRTVIVKNNPDAPVITMNGLEEIRLPIGDPWVDPGFSVADFEGNPIDTTNNPVRITGEVNPELLGEYPLKYDFTSDEGNPARTARRTVLVVDATPPAITLVGDTEMTIFQGQPFTDPGASAFDDYDGNLQVGSSQNLPQEGLVVHLDASNIKALQDGEPVHVWKDASPAGNHFKFAVGDPLYKTNGTNDLPTVLFDGTSQIRTETNFANAYTISTVSQMHGSQNQRLIASYNRNWLFGYHAGKQDSFHPEAWVTPGTANVDALPHLHTATSTGTTDVRFYVDNVDKTISPKRNGQIGQLQLGAYQTLNQSSIGEVSEVLLYNRKLGTTERLSLEAYLNAKYALNGAPEVNIPVNILETGTYHILYQSIDGEGNVGSAVRTVHVVPDPDAPVITLAGESEIIWEAGTPWAEPGFTLSDKDGALDASLVEINNPIADDTTTQGEFIITYNYKPFVGAQAPEVSRLIIVRDTEPPVITLDGDSFIKLEKDAVWTDPGYSAADAGTGVVPVISDELLSPNQMRLDAFIIDGADDSVLNLDQNGGIKAMDPEASSFFDSGPGNRGADFNNSAEMGSPRGDQFQILFHAKFFAPVAGTYEFAHVDRDGNICLWLDLDQDEVFELDGDKGNERIMGINQGGWRIATLQPGVYDLAFAYREGTGGERFHVRMGLPEILVPYENQNIRPVSTQQLGLWAAPRTAPTVDTATPGTYTITYHARDITGNATTATRTVVVVDDASKPFIALKGEAVMTHELGTAFTDPGATVTAGDGTELEANLEAAAPLDITQLGPQTLTYEYTDAVSATRTVTLVDTTPPTATLTAHPIYGGTDTVTLLANQTWVDPGLTVNDGDSTAWYVSSRDYIPNRLHHAGFNFRGEVNFDNNGGLLVDTPAATRFFTTGNANRGFDYNSDAEFRSAGIGITVNDNYSSYILGYFHARIEGEYTFNTDRSDDDIALWLDLNQNENFEASGNEQLTFDNQEVLAFLQPGFYKFAVGHREGTGNSLGRARIQAPAGAGPSTALANIKPADPAQNGLWLTEGEGFIDTTFPGTHTITYYLMDQSGNSSTTTRTVIINPDPDAPILALVGDAEVPHEQGTPYTDPSVTIKNEAGVDLDPGPLTTTITQGGQFVATLDTDLPGVATYLYQYDDGSRTAIPVTRTVTIADTTAPTLELVGDATVTIPPGFIFKDPGVTLADAVDASPDLRISGDKVEYLYPGTLMNGLISSWGFEEKSGNTAFDSLLENHLSFKGTPLRADTIHGRGLSFNTNGTAEATDSPSLSITNALSLSVWLKPTADQVEWTKVAIKSRGDRYPYGFGYSDADQFLWMLSNDASVNVPAGELPTLNKWTHALGTWDGTDSTLYINGVLQATAQVDAPLLDNDLNFAVGGRETNQNRFQGLIDSVAIWNRALSADEALQLQHSSGIRTFTEGEYQITYTATDTTGNTSTVSRTVIVKTDPTLPIISLLGEKEYTLEAGTPFEEPGALPHDSRDNPLDHTKVTVSGSVDHTKLGLYLLIYNFTNDDGKDAVPVHRRITVVDTTPPVIELTGGTEYRVELGTPEWVDPGVVITDNLDTGLTADITLQPLTSETPIAHWEFDHTDGTVLEELYNNLDGTLRNFSDPVADSWVDGKYGKALKFDGVSNYIALPGTAMFDLTQLTITAWVNCSDYDLSMFVLEKTTDNTLNSQYGFFFDSGISKFRINDGSGGFLDASINTIEFAADEWQHIAAVYDGSIQQVYLNGELSAEIQQDITLPTAPAAGPAYIGAYAKGEGYFFNGLIDDLKIYGTALEVDDIQFAMRRNGIDTTTATTQPYILEYTTTDAAGHTTTIQRKIMVSDDLTSPVITLAGDADMTLEAASNWTDPGFSAIDNKDGNITPLVTVTSTPELDPEIPGEYTLAYNVMDSAFNKADEVTRKVTVQDTTAPVITLLGEAAITIEKGAIYTDPGATALDALDGDVTDKISTNGTLDQVDTNTPGDYTVTYDVTDLAGNTATQVTRTITVKISDKFVAWVEGKSLPDGKDGLLDDPDHDRVPNLLEYAIGGNPMDADRKSTLPEVNKESGSLKVTFLRIKTSVDGTLTYKVELARKLKGGTWNEADVTVTVDADQTGVPADYEKVTATSNTPIANETEGRQFIRITVERP